MARIDTRSTRAGNATGEASSYPHVMHHVIAVTARPQTLSPGGYREAPVAAELPEDLYLPELAARLDLTVYELRGRLAGGSPWIISRVADAWEADACTQWLRRKGFGAVTVDLQELEERLATARGPISLRDEGVVLGELTVGYARVAVAFDTMILAELTSDTVEQRVMGRGSRGQPNVVEVTSASYQKSRRRSLILFSAEGDGWTIEQGVLRAAEFGGATSLARYESFLSALRSRCVQARVDARLVTSPRRRTSFTLLSLDHESNARRSDNARETAVAAYALHRAALEGQRC